MRACHRYCIVNNTLKQSGFRFRTTCKLVADLTTVYASICSVTLAEFIDSDFGLCLIPRVVDLVAKSTSLTFYIFVINVRLGINFKVFICILKLTPRSLAAKSTSIDMSSKVAASTMGFCPK